MHDWIIYVRITFKLNLADAVQIPLCPISEFLSYWLWCDMQFSLPQYLMNCRTISIYGFVVCSFSSFLV